MVNGKIDKDGKLYLPLLCSGEPTLNQDSSEGHQKVKKDIWERGGTCENSSMFVLDGSNSLRFAMPAGNVAMRF